MSGNEGIAEYSTQSINNLSQHLINAVLQHIN